MDWFGSRPFARPLTWLGLFVLLLQLVGGGWAAQAADPTGQPEGAALALELRQQAPAESFTNSGVLRLRDAKGHRRQMPVTVATLVGTNGWRVVYLVGDGTNGVVETLTVQQGRQQAPHYEVSRRATGAVMAEPPQAIPAGNSAVALAGTDFWLCDLGLEFLHWPEQRVARQELSNGRLCWALDSVNPGTNGYASVRSWIDCEFHALLRAEAYDSQRRKVKEFSTGKFSQVSTRDGREAWFLRDIRIRDEVRDSRTELVYDLPRE
jgi:hypothetical protein